MKAYEIYHGDLSSEVFSPIYARAIVQVLF
jgi:hypothetical protein